MTGSSGLGKSTVAFWLLRRFPGPKVAIDPGNSALLDTPAFFTTHDPSGSDWADRQNIRFVPVDFTDQDAYAALYAHIRDLVQTERWPCAAVLADEAETCLPANARGPAPAFVFSGRKWPTAHITTATRPVNISTATRANLTNAVIFPLYMEDDRKTIAGDLGIPLKVLEGAMAALPTPGPDGTGERGFLWWTTATRSLQPVIC